MKTNNILYKTAERYLDAFPDEYDAMDALRGQISAKENLGSRKNFTGHVTGSGIVIQDSHILLIFHNKLQRFLQPGGHYDDDATIAACAQREVEEETGLSVVLHEWHGKNSGIPIHIDTHRIPENKKRGEDAHYHHDHAFIFILKGNGDISLQEDEVGDYKWIPMKMDFDDLYLSAVVRKIKTLGLL